MNWGELNIWEKIIVVTIGWLLAIITITMFIGERGC